jgi:hypothetical protein
VNVYVVRTIAMVMLLRDFGLYRLIFMPICVCAKLAFLSVPKGNLLVSLYITDLFAQSL